MLYVYDIISFCNVCGISEISITVISDFSIAILKFKTSFNVSAKTFRSLYFNSLFFNKTNSVICVSLYC